MALQSIMKGRIGRKNVATHSVDHQLEIMLPEDMHWADNGPPATCTTPPKIPTLKGAPSLTVAARKIVRPGRKGRTCAPIPNKSNVSCDRKLYKEDIIKYHHKTI